MIQEGLNMSLILNIVSSAFRDIFNKLIYNYYILDKYIDIIKKDNKFNNECYLSQFPLVKATQGNQIISGHTFISIISKLKYIFTHIYIIFIQNNISDIKSLILINKLEILNEDGIKCEYLKSFFNFRDKYF